MEGRRRAIIHMTVGLPEVNETIISYELATIQSLDGERADPLRSGCPIPTVYN